MRDEIYVSLCIATNGIIEWVIPVLDSIYNTGCDTKLFEVIVTDNGNNSEFEDLMHNYELKYNNFIYKKTNSVMFMNQIESFKLANGKLIKFINHRMMLTSDALKIMLDFVNKYEKEKPAVYFSNGALGLKNQLMICNTFDKYVRALSYWSSWSAGTAIWKSDFKMIDLTQNFNSLFPHTDIVFSDRKKKYYVINDKTLLKEIPSDNTQKGKYDLFNAFAVEYPHIIERLYDDGDISKRTYKYVKRKNGFFVSGLYYDYIIRKLPCSYDLNGFDLAMGKYYSKSFIYQNAAYIALKKGAKRILLHE